MPAIPFVGPAYQSTGVSTDAQECINLYLEINGPDAKSPASLIGCPGLRKMFTLAPSGGGTIRGMHTTGGGRFFVVAGATLYEITTIWGAYAERGTLTTSSGHVAMSDNPTQMILADGTAGWVFTFATNTLSQITDVDYIDGATTVTHQDGYFITDEPSSGRFRLSALNDGTTWSSLDFATAEAIADNLVRPMSNGRELWLFGERTTEVWYNSGAAAFPFERIAGASSEIGCEAKWSVAKSHQRLFWLGSGADGNGIVYMSDGYVPKRISNHAIEKDIQSYSDISDAISWTYQQRGHVFYVLSFPTANKTWCYDLASGAWHRRAYLNSATGEQDRHRGAYQTFFERNIFIGDHSNGNVYILDHDYYTDDTQEILRVRTSPHIHADRKRLFFSSLEIDVETGVGLESGQGSNPLATLYLSDDGGRTYGAGLTASMGAIGEYSTRLKFNRLGASRDRVFKLEISEPVKVIINAAHISAKAEV